MFISTPQTGTPISTACRDSAFTSAESITKSLKDSERLFFCNQSFKLLLMRVSTSTTASAKPSDTLSSCINFIFIYSSCLSLIGLPVVTADSTGTQSEHASSMASEVGPDGATNASVLRDGGA